MKAQILEVVNQKHISSDGKCGTYFVEFLTKINITASQFEKLITELYNDDLVDIRIGINGYLVLKK